MRLLGPEGARYESPGRSPEESAAQRPAKPQRGALCECGGNAMGSAPFQCLCDDGRARFPGAAPAGYRSAPLAGLLG